MNTCQHHVTANHIFARSCTIASCSWCGLESDLIPWSGDKTWQGRKMPDDGIDAKAIELFKTQHGDKP